MGMNGTAWRSLIASIPDEGYFQKEQAAAREQQAREHKAALDRDAANAEADLQERRLREFLSGGFGKGTEKRSYNPQTNQIGAAENDVMQQMAMNDRALDNQRLETKALQDEYGKLRGFKPEQMTALEDVENLLKSNDRTSYGQLQTAIARLRDVGALSEGDVNRALPNTLKRDVKNLAGYFGMGGLVGKEMLNEAEIANIKNIIGERRAAMLAQGARAGEELQGRAASLAPSLAASRRLKPTLESLGVSSRLTQKEAPMAPPPPAAAAPKAPMFDMAAIAAEIERRKGRK